MNESAPRPRAFRLDESAAQIEEAPDAYALEAQRAQDSQGTDPQEAAVEEAQKRGMAARALLSAAGLFWSALAGLLVLALGGWLMRLIEDSFARTPALGYLALALSALAGAALLVMVWREMRGVMRQRAIARLHAALAAARAQDDRDAARAHVRTLCALYDARPELAGARAHILSLTREIVDGRDLIDIAEREIMSPLDARAAQAVADAARRTSIVTALSPRAIVDLVFVAAQALRLVRAIAEIYGGRPGSLGFLRILRSVAAHLAITGGVAAGDSLLQQALGHGLAARLSARLGEGVLNGLLTARVGLSAMAVCRPMPYAARKPPGVSEVAPFLLRSEGKAKA
jgi:putative membrane protein